MYTLFEIWSDDGWFSLQTFLHQFCCTVIIRRKCDLKSCLVIRGTPGESNSVTTYLDSPSTLLPLLTEGLIQGVARVSRAVSLGYLSSSSFSLFSLCSRASRLFSASSLVASSGSVVPAEVFGEALAVRVDGGAGGGLGRRLGPELGLRLPPEQLYKQVQGESQLETKAKEQNTN